MICGTTLVRNIAIIAALGASLQTPGGRVGAQEGPQDAAPVERGRTIADRICWVCHVTGPDQEYSPILKEPGPDFRAIAERPDATSASLTAFQEK